MVFGLGIFLALLSLLYSQHIIGVDENFYEYGFPIPWLDYTVAIIFPANSWGPPITIIFAIPFWLFVSLVSLTFYWKIKAIQVSNARAATDSLISL